VVEPSAVQKRTNTPAQVLFASVIGTTIEFFDFFTYANASVLVFPNLFFPPTEPTLALPASLATFGIAFLARPIGSALFGHFGDRVGRNAGTTPLSARLAEGGRRRILIVVNALIVGFGFLIAPMFTAGTIGAAAMMMLGMALMGLVYGPPGTVLCELFPTAVRYSGTSLTFNLAGIFGASLAPSVATSLARRYGLQWVGYYLSTASVLSVVGLLLTHETRDVQL
jgi:MFS family permease